MVLLGKLTGTQLVKKFSSFYGTHNFITLLLRSSYLSITWANTIQSMCSFHFLKINVFTILRSEPESTKWSLFLTFFNQISICNFSLSIRLHTSEMPRLSHSSWFSHADNIWCGVEIMKIATVQSSSLSCYLILLRPIHFPRLPLLEHSQPIYLPHCERQICTPVYNKEQSYNSVYFNLYISGKQSDRQSILHIAGASIP